MHKCDWGEGTNTLNHGSLLLASLIHALIRLSKVLQTLLAASTGASSNTQK